MDSDDEYGADNGTVNKTSKIASDGTKIWTMTEKNRFERCLMLYGFSSWDKMLPQFSRRSEKDLEAVAKLVIIFCINTGQVEHDLANEMRRMIGLEAIAAPPPVEEGQEAPKPEPITLPEIPYPAADERKIAEYRSFLLDTTPEYREHIERKGLSTLALTVCVKSQESPYTNSNVKSYSTQGEPSAWSRDSICPREPSCSLVGRRRRSRSDDWHYEIWIWYFCLR